MLVSSHTITVWVNPNDVPKAILSAFPPREQNDNEAFLFIPKVMEEELFSKWVDKVFASCPSVALPYGKAYAFDASGCVGAKMVDVSKNEEIVSC
jgi:hypothetical protein